MLPRPGVQEIDDRRGDDLRAALVVMADADRFPRRSGPGRDPASHFVDRRVSPIAAEVVAGLGDGLDPFLKLRKADERH